MLCQNFIDIAVVKHIVVANVAFLNRVTAAHQKALAVEIWHFRRQARRRFANPERQFHILFKIQRLAVVMIAAEQFVRALARQHDLDLFACKIGKEIQRDGRGVRQRFVHIILHHRGDGKVFLGGNFFGVIAHALGFGKFLGGGEFGIFFLRIPDGKSLHIVALRHFVHHITRIHAAGQEAPDLDIGNAVRLGGVFEGFVNQRFPITKRFAVVNIVFGRKIARSCKLPVLPFKVGTGFHFIHIFEHRFGVRNVLKAKVFGQAVNV